MSLSCSVVAKFCSNCFTMLCGKVLVGIVAITLVILGLTVAQKLSPSQSLDEATIQETSSTSTVPTAAIETDAEVPASDNIADESTTVAPESSTVKEADSDVADAVVETTTNTAKEPTTVTNEWVTEHITDSTLKDAFLADLEFAAHDGHKSGSSESQSADKDVVEMDAESGETLTDPETLVDSVSDKKLKRNSENISRKKRAVPTQAPSKDKVLPPLPQESTLTESELRLAGLA